MFYLFVFFLFAAAMGLGAGIYQRGEGISEEDRLMLKVCENQDMKAKDIQDKKINRKTKEIRFKCL